MKNAVLGYYRFKSKYFKQKQLLFSKLAKAQNPDILFITCSDSRVDPCVLTQTDPGEIFVIRNAGNIVPAHSIDTCGVSASIEFAVQAIGVKHIVICGHSDCGAMKGVIDPSTLKNLPNVKNWLNHSKRAVEMTLIENDPLISKELNTVIRNNILIQIKNLRTHNVVLQKLKTNSLEIHGWFYDIGKGSLDVFDESTGLFIPAEEKYKTIF